MTDTTVTLTSCITTKRETTASILSQLKKVGLSEENQIHLLTLTAHDPTQAFEIAEDLFKGEDLVSFKFLLLSFFNMCACIDFLKDQSSN